MTDNDRIQHIASIIDPVAFRDRPTEPSVLDDFWQQPERERALIKARQIFDFMIGGAVPTNDNIDFKFPKEAVREPNKRCE